MDYGDDFLGSDDDFLASEDEYLQSIEEDGTIYDDINLEDEISDNVDEKILDIINNKLLNGEIEDYSYALDNILIKVALSSEDILLVSFSLKFSLKLSIEN